MIWEKRTRSDAKDMADEWNKMDEDAFLKTVKSWCSKSRDDLTNDYWDLRESLWAFYESADEVSVASGGYLSDLNFGLNLYSFMNEKMGMTSSIASDDDVWRYIQMDVLPDLIFKRWSKEQSDRINDDRFWKNTRRIWLKVLWWYVHLSLQNDSVEETKLILANNSSDDISQLVERSGSGYRIKLYRMIMLKYSQSSRSDKLLRKVLKLNVIRCATVEPLLIESEIEAYVDSLFKYFEVI